MKSSTGVISSLGGVEAIKDKPADEMNIKSRTNSRNGEVLSTANDTFTWIKPLSLLEWM